MLGCQRHAGSPVGALGRSRHARLPFVRKRPFETKRLVSNGCLRTSPGTHCVDRSLSCYPVLKAMPRALAQPMLVGIAQPVLRESPEPDCPTHAST